MYKVESAEKVVDPRPRVPVLPVLSWKACVGRRSPRPPSVLEAGWKIALTRGAAAIALALQHAKIGQGDNVLVPAFHCRSMIEPFLAARAQLTYYRIAEDLSVDFDDIQTKLNCRPRALLVVHYFGFLQDMPRLRSLCDAHGIVLIEDCAHAFFGAIDGHPVGWYGDYGVVSVRKFFPIQDGGYLVSARRPFADLGVKSAGLAYNLKSAFDAVETAFHYRRLNSLSALLGLLLSVKSYLWKKTRGRNASIGPGVSEGYEFLDLAWTHKAMSVISRGLVRLSPQASIAEERCRNYNRLVAGLSGLREARPLRPLLPAGVVPYMFPFVVDAPGQVFRVLKEQGVPIWRWENLAPSGCEVSRRYAQSLFQLPCHQALFDDEIDWMIATIRKAISDETASMRAPASG